MEIIGALALLGARLAKSAPASRQDLRADSTSLRPTYLSLKDRELHGPNFMGPVCSEFAGTTRLLARQAAPAAAAVEEQGACQC
jgi:hypothetical protein